MRGFFLKLFFTFVSFYFLGCTPGKETVEDIPEDSTKFEYKSTDSTTHIDSTSESMEIDSLVQKFEDPQRVEWQNPSLVIEKLGDIHNKTIADIGAGSGYFTFPLASKALKVIAVDIENQFLEFIEERKYSFTGEGVIENIETRLCTEQDPLLENDEVDMALLVNTYSFIENRTEYLLNTIKGIKNGGSIIIVDYKAGDIPVGPIDSSKVDFEIVVKELKSAGFKVEEVDSVSLKYQYIIIANK